VFVDFCGFCDLQDNFHFLPHFNSKTTEPIFTIFSHDVEQLVELLMRVSARRYAILFRNDRAISAGGYVILPHFCH